ncbi:MAG: hypothetical protein IKZ60_06550 [Bacteroidales bacterium]|nr:hypothetical protein [Bacteroidales bacterium]
MKKYYFILAAVAAMLSAVSCNKEQNTTDNSEPAEGQEVTIKVTIPEDLSKVALEYVGDALELTWSAGDKIRVAEHGNASNYQDFTLSSGEGTKNATFTGTAISAASYDITLSSGMPANPLAQTQSADESTAHLGYSATLSGVNTYDDVTFSSAWASANGGGTLAQSGALHLQVTLPAGVAETINLVTMVADKNIFGATGTMTVTLTNQEDNGNPDILDVYATIPAGGVAIPSGTGLLFKFGSTNASHTVYTRYYKTPSALNLAGGQLNLIYLTGSNCDKYAGKDDNGTEAHPFLIADKYQMITLMNLYKTAEDANATVKYYVKLVDDIDLKGVDWVPFNRAGTYKRETDFDGNGHTISNLSVNGESYAYPSFFGVLYGTARNITFEKPTIVGGGNNAGVVGGYIGTGSNVGNCSGITVNNATVSGIGKNVGGFAGVVGAAGTISNCHVTGTNSITQSSTTTGRSAGGFIGNVNAAATITNCTAVANVTNSSSYYTGGFIGQYGANTGPATITNCAYLGGTISAGRSNANSPVAGFIARVAAGGADCTNCYVEGATITASVCGRVGGFVGDTGSSASTVFKSCYVKSSSISGAINTGGFGGVVYATIDKSYVESTTINANGNNTGGFVGYLQLYSPAEGKVTNSYTTATVIGGTNNNIGGFVGNLLAGATVTSCYANASVSGTGTGVGAFIGWVEAAPTSVTKNIAWNDTLPFRGAVKDAVDESAITGNYYGTSGTISSQATTLGWDGSIWDLTGSVPTLK